MPRRESARDYKMSPDAQREALELDEAMKRKRLREPGWVPAVRPVWTAVELIDEERAQGAARDRDADRRLVSLTAAGIDSQQGLAINTPREQEVQAITQLARAVLVRVTEHPADDYFSELFRPRYQKEEKALLEMLRRTIFRSVLNLYTFDDVVSHGSFDLQDYHRRLGEDRDLHESEPEQDRSRRREREDFERLETYSDEDWDIIARTGSTVCLEFLKRTARIATYKSAHPDQEQQSIAQVIQAAGSLLDVLPQIERTTGVRMDFSQLLDRIEIPDHFV